jgi:hypothetical protein
MMLRGQNGSWADRGSRSGSRCRNADPRRSRGNVAGLLRTLLVSLARSDRLAASHRTSARTGVPTGHSGVAAGTSERVARVDSASMIFYPAQGKGLPCCRHPVISVQ